MGLMLRELAYALLFVLGGIAIGYLQWGLDRRPEKRQFCHFASGWADSSHTALRCILWWNGDSLLELR